MTDIIGFGELLSLGCAITWAIGVIFLRNSSQHGSPLVLNTFKIALAVLLFIPTIILTETPLTSLNQYYDVFLLMISGIIGIGIADTLWLSALKRTDASTIAIVDCMYSPSVIVMSLLFLGESLSSYQIIGSSLVVSALFVVTLYSSNKSQVKRIDHRGIIYGTMAVFFMAIGVIIMEPILDKFPLLIAIEIRLLAGLLFLTGQLLLSGGLNQLKELTLVPNKWSLLLGSFFTAYLSMLLWVGGTKYTTASISAVLNQTSTFFIVVLASLILKEKLSRAKIVGCVLGFSGCLIIIFS